MSTNDLVEADKSGPEQPRPSILRKATRTPEQQARREWQMRCLNIALAAGVPVALLLLWQIAATREWIDPRLFPAPSTVWSRTVTLAEDGELWKHVRATLSRIVIGFVIGASAGIILGAAMGRITVLRAALRPTMNALYVVPKIALLPVFVTIFGLGTPSMLGLVVTTVFFFTWVNTLGAFMQIPTGYLEAAHSLELSAVRRFFSVLLPASLPQLFIGLTVAMNVAILVTVGSEFVVGSDGLGYLIEHAREIFIPEQIYAGIAVVSILGVILASIVIWVGRLLTPWQR